MGIKCNKYSSSLLLYCYLQSNHSRKQMFKLDFCFYCIIVNSNKIGIDWIKLLSGNHFTFKWGVEPWWKLAIKFSCLSHSSYFLHLFLLVLPSCTMKLNYLWTWNIIYCTEPNHKGFIILFICLKDNISLFNSIRHKEKENTKMLRFKFQLWHNSFKDSFVWIFLEG